MTALLLSLTVAAAAQTPAEIAAGSIPLVNGPSTAEQPGRFLLNTSGTTYAASNSAVKVTATISNHQYVGSNTGAGNPVLVFGAATTAGGSAPTSRPTYAAMNDIAAPANSQFSNTADGTAGGIDVATNYAFNFFTSLRHWAGSTTPATNSRRYMADLTFTFSVPLTDPLMQIVGLGGSTTNSGTLGFATELDLVTPGVTLSKVHGNTALAVSASQIRNNLASGIGASCSTNVAACGTIKVTGANIQSLTFRVYIRGDGGIANWGSTSNHSGDQWLAAFSIPETYTLSGTVYNDLNGLGDDTVNGTGTGTPSGTQIYANLVEPATGKVIGTTAVAANGAYSFQGIPKGSAVRVELSTSQGTEYADAPARALPMGWFNKGENVGAGAGHDGSPDGTVATTVSANVANVNFGINQVPTAAPLRLGGRVLIGGRAAGKVAVTVYDTVTMQMQTTLTGSFGYFRFDNLPAGNFFIVTATDRRTGLTATKSLQLFEAREDLLIDLGN